MLCRCQPRHRGEPLPADLNPASPVRDPHARWTFAIVPGFTPRLGWRAGLHAIARERCDAAIASLERGRIANVIVSGGSVHSPDNEAWLMREYLLARGVPAARVFAEPCARHTTTNLRNAGRMLLALGVEEALVLTSDRLGIHPRRFFQQAFYIGRPWLSGFHARCVLELGYRVGELAWIATGAIQFRPSRNVLRASWKETVMGDP